MAKEKFGSSPILPGETVASIEEFEGGKNTYITDGAVRASALGVKVYDLKRRIVKVDPKNSPMLPKVGDILVGYIEMLFGSMLSIRVLYINERKTLAGFSAISSTRLGGRGERGEGGRRGRITFRVGDIVRGRVVSLLNSTIHITIDDKDLGVLYALCYVCGGNTVRVNNAIKCIECGIMEDRKLTNDYGKETVRMIHKVGSK